VTIGDWLDSRTPVPPELLAARVRQVLGGSLARPSAEALGHCLEAVDGLLVSLRDDPDAGRERALDLLAADALVTYAFEAAAEAPHELADIAAAAMWRVGSVAAGLGA